jgi:acyl-CoA thioester hydrolase
MSDGVYRFRVAVDPRDIDVQNHVNNVAFVRIVQDAAVAHWKVIAPAEVRAAVSWVARRHEVDYHKPGLPGDELEVRTWVGEPTAATWERFTEIARAGDGEVLVTARTVWVLVDAATGRPKRIDAAMKALFPKKA